MTPNAKKFKTTLITIRGSLPYIVSRGSVTPKSGNKTVNKKAQQNQDNDISIEGDGMTLGYTSNYDNTVKTNTKDAEKDKKRKHSVEKMNEDIDLTAKTIHVVKPRSITRLAKLRLRTRTTITIPMISTKRRRRRRRRRKMTVGTWIFQSGTTIPTGSTTT
jgi:hypothetical protein